MRKPPRPIDNRGSISRCFAALLGAKENALWYQISLVPTNSMSTWTILGSGGVLRRITGLKSWDG